jgi:hypothetical protein
LNEENFNFPTDRGDPMVVTAGSHEVNADVHREFPISHTFRGAEQYRSLVQKCG